jgi:hypothetical protein
MNKPFQIRFWMICNVFDIRSPHSFSLVAHLMRRILWLSLVTLKFIVSTASYIKENNSYEYQSVHVKTIQEGKIDTNI